MSKYQEIQKALAKILRKRSNEASVVTEAEEDANESMTEGRKPRVFGINKKLTYFLAGLAIVVFTFGFISGFFPSSTPKKADKTLETATPVTKPRSPISDSIPDGYNNPSLRMSAYDAQQKGGRTAAAPTTTNRSSNQQAMDYYQSNIDPMIPNQSTYARSRQDYSDMANALASVKQQTVPTEVKKEQYASPIRVSFGVSNTELADTQQGKQTAVPGTAAGASFVGASPNSLQAGTLIPAVLISGINSEVGGHVMAQVQRDIYDSLYGRTLLIPAGSRLIGQYNAGAVVGQNRISITWTQLILPNGGSYALGNAVVAVDSAGYAGLPGKVNNHSGQILGGAAATSALAALGSIAAGNTGNSDTYTAGQLATQGAMGNLLNTASSMMQKNINISPTITIEPGSPFNVLIGQSLLLQPY